MPHQTAGGLGCWVLRPLQCAAEAHVQDVGAIVQHHFHRFQNDVLGGRAFAPEHAIGMKSDARGDALDRAVGADDPADVRAVAVAVIWKRIGNRRGIVRR
jgi:hypothetical protein